MSNEEFGSFGIILQLLLSMTTKPGVLLGERKALNANTQSLPHPQHQSELRSSSSLGTGGGTMTISRVGPKKGAAEMDCRKFLAVSRNTGQRNHCPGPDFHLMWPLVPLFMSIMERNKMPENFLHPDCKNRVKVGHFLHYFRAHSLLLKHVM